MYAVALQIKKRGSFFKEGDSGIADYFGNRLNDRRRPTCPPIDVGYNRPKSAARAAVRLEPPSQLMGMAICPIDEHCTGLGKGSPGVPRLMLTETLARTSIRWATVAHRPVCHTCTRLLLMR